MPYVPSSVPVNGNTRMAQPSHLHTDLSEDSTYHPALYHFFRCGILHNSWVSNTCDRKDTSS